MNFTTQKLAILLLILASGCSALINPPKPLISIEDFLVDNSSYPTEANAFWKEVATAIINAPPSDIYEEIVNPVSRITEEMPKGTYLIVDHSLSDAGPKSWGNGSVATLCVGKKTGYIVVEKCEKPNLVTHRALLSRNEQTIRSITHHRLTQTGDNKTLLEVTSLGSPHYKPHFAGLNQWYHELRTKRELNQLINEYGGEIISIDAQTNKDVPMPE